MSKLERIFGILVVSSLLFNIFLIVGASLLTVFAWLGLAIVYTPLGVFTLNRIPLKHIFKKESYRGISKIKIIEAIGLGVGLSIICLGIIFKIQDYPNPNSLLVVGLSIGLPFTIIAIGKFQQTRDPYFLNLTKRFLVIGSLGYFLYNITNEEKVRFLYRNHPDFLKAYNEYRMDTSNVSLREKLELEGYKVTMGEEDFNMEVEKYIYMFKDMPNSELESISVDKKNVYPEAREAARQVLENRNQSNTR